MSADLSPYLGHPAARFPHGKRFLEWARDRGQTTIAQQLLTLIGDFETEQALGSTLQFLTQPATLHALRDWAAHPAAGYMLDLSEELATSPPLAKPLLDGVTPTEAFQKTLAKYYLSAQIAAHPHAELSPDQKLRLHRLRVWLLVTSLDALLAGHARERRLRTVCTQLRIGLDAKAVEGGNPQETEERLNKVRWFVSVAPAETDFAQFSASLNAKLNGHEIGNDSGLKDARNALRGLAKRDYRHIKSTGDGDDLADGVHFSASESHARPAVSPSGACQLAVEEIEVHELPMDPDEADSRLLEIRTEKPTPVSELHALSRRIALQTDEDRQHLHISWTRLSPWESNLLHTKIRQDLSAPNDGTRLLAAVAAVAVLTQLSMRSIDHIRLDPPRGAERAHSSAVWTLDLAAGTLNRNAARHLKAAQRSADLAPWTEDISEEWILKLDPLLVQPIAKAWSLSPAATTLSNLFPGSAETAFNQWTNACPELWRVSSGFLAITGEQRVFEETNDLTFARLLLNWPASATSGAMAYPGWTREHVARGFKTIAPDSLVTLSPADERTNAMGSRLSLIDAKIAFEVRRAGERVAEIANTTDWVAFHNAFTTYCVTCLLIMTGARPARSVFERLSHFDLQRGRLFLDDKASLEVVGDKSGRVIPLPRAASKLLIDLYLPYLRHLHSTLAELGTSLATELATIFNPTDPPLLPLFFRLRHSDPDEWLEVTEKGLIDRSVFDWPLPANAFRHRMATALRQAGLDPELVDAHLGHAEAGSETYGDLSVRCWIDEEPRWRECVENSLVPLALQFPPLSFPVPGLRPATSDHPAGPARVFGIEFRKLIRDSVAKTAREEACKTFEKFVAEKPPTARSADEWEHLRDAIVFDNNGNVRNAAFHRYQALQDQLYKLQSESGIEVSVRTWVHPQHSGRSAFGPASILAPEKVDSLRAALDGAYDVLAGTVPAKRTCAWMCVTDLSVNSGLSDPDELACVAHARIDRLALLVVKDVAYLEICSEGRTVAEGPVKRYVLTSRSLPLLNHLMSPARAKIYERPTATDSAIDKLVNALSFSKKLGIDRWIDKLCHWIDHHNSLHRPGLQAGVLSGRVSTYALSRTDFLAAQFGDRLLVASTVSPGSPPPSRSAFESEGGQSWRHARRAPTSRNSLDARSLLTALRKILEGFEDRRRQSSAPPSNESAEKLVTPTRAETSAKMSEAVRNASPNVPKNVRLLAEWVLHLLGKGASKKELAGPTVIRYLGALSSGFLALSHTVDITEGDQEEVTDFYRHVIDPALTDPKLTGAAKNGDESPKKAQQYVLDRLIDFHRYAERYGAVSPYWDEISGGLTNSAVSPGFITPAEYAQALTLLCPDPTEADPAQLQRAFFLLLTYRFGLRGGEAIHLSMRNWIDIANSTVLIVDHKHRKLKTPGSRRKVPLIYPLSEHERSVVDAWRAFRRGSTDFSEKRRLLVNVDGQTDLSDLDELRAHVVTALRWSTHNEAIKLHHARHSLANLVGVPLITGQKDRPTLWSQVMDSNVGFDHHEHIRKLLLGSALPTRRSLWAVSRMLGHSRRETTCASYLHFLLDWCNQTSRQNAHAHSFGRPKLKLRQVTYLDDAERAPAHTSSPNIAAKPTYSRLDVAGALEYLRSRSRGLSPSQAATGTFGRLSPETSTRLEVLLDRFATRFSQPTRVPSPSSTESFVRRVPMNRWAELFKLARLCDQLQFCLPIAALEQISPGMQLILAKKEHFEHLRDVVDRLNLTCRDIRIRTPDQPNPRMLAFLTSTTLQGLIEPAKPIKPGKWGNRRRIDSFKSEDDKDPGTYGHRFAALVPPKSLGVFTDARDLVTLWICLSVTEKSY